MLLDHAFLIEHLHYDPETGIWTLRQATSRRKIGARADAKINKIYRSVFFAGKQYYSHILAWFYMTGTWPNRDIDHADTDGSNNSWDNLRLATESQNGGNSKLSKKNTSGIKGVVWDKNRNKWKAQIKVKRKIYALGRFDKKEDAVAARKSAAATYFGEFARA